MNDKKIEMIGKMRAENYTYFGIGKALGLSGNTVKSICRKYGFVPDENAQKKNINHTVAYEEQPRCKFCGEVMSNPWNRIGKEFCSDKCRYRWWNRERRIMNYIPSEPPANLSQEGVDFQA